MRVKKLTTYCSFSSICHKYLLGNYQTRWQQFSLGVASNYSKNLNSGNNKFANNNNSSHNFLIDDEDFVDYFVVKLFFKTSGLTTGSNKKDVLEEVEELYRVAEQDQHKIPSLDEVLSALGSFWHTEINQNICRTVCQLMWVDTSTALLTPHFFSVSSESRKKIRQTRRLKPRKCKNNGPDQNLLIRHLVTTNRKPRIQAMQPPCFLIMTNNVCPEKK